jgi:hypothetical protein
MTISRLFCTPENKKTEFSSRQGLQQLKVMPSGLCSTLTIFKQLMESVLQGFNYKACLVFLDDVVIVSWTFQEQHEL